MMKKLKIILRVSKKGIKKILRGDVNYRGKNPLQIVQRSVKELQTKGFKPTLSKIKHEMLSIDRRLGANIAFPNGLVTGVDKNLIAEWYKGHSKPIQLVIPSYNDLNVLIPCIESIKATTDPEKVKVIIVDDYCQPENKKELQKLEDEQVTVIYREKNGGFAKAVNTGLRATNKKQDVILVNSDIIAHEGWVEALQYGAYEFGVDTGIVGPKLLYPDGRIQSAGAHRNTDVPEYFDHYYRFQDSDYGPANIPQYCMGTTGACMYIKREVLNNVGLLDEKFQFAFEDMDLCVRAWIEGYRTLYFPSAILTHVESATRDKNKTMSEKEKSSVAYFWKKWGKWFDDRNVEDSNGKRKIIFVLQTFGFSGGIKNIFEQANRLYDRGFSVEIWGLDKNPSPWETRDGLKIRTFKNYDRLIVALSKEEALKVATWWETAFPVWLSSICKGIPVYFISEFETWFYPDDIVAQASVISCYRKEFRNITISPYNLDELRSIGLTAEMIPCGYEDETYRVLEGVQREDDTILAVGRSFFQKNFKMTLGGWNMLGDTKPNMWLFGGEPEMAKLDDKIKYFTKPSNEAVNELYNKATMFIQTSKHEGFCLPILEAMAAGCPVITTDSHGNRGFCFNNKNCLMVEQDNEQELSEAINKLLNNKKLRDKLAANALKTVKDYQWDKIIDGAEEIYGKTT